MILLHWVSVRPCSLTEYVFEAFYTQISFISAKEEKMPSLFKKKKSPWVLSAAPNSWSAIYFQFSVQQRQKMSPVVITHFRFAALSQSLVCLSSWWKAVVYIFARDVFCRDRNSSSNATPPSPDTSLTCQLGHLCSLYPNIFQIHKTGFPILVEGCNF